MEEYVLIYTGLKRKIYSQQEYDSVVADNLVGNQQVFTQFRGLKAGDICKVGYYINNESDKLISEDLEYVENNDDDNSYLFKKEGTDISIKWLNLESITTETNDIRHFPKHFL